MSQTGERADVPEREDEVHDDAGQVNVTTSLRPSRRRVCDSFQAERPCKPIRAADGEEEEHQFPVRSDVMEVEVACGKKRGDVISTAERERDGRSWLAY
jgi:hypothetical protein